MEVYQTASDNLVQLDEQEFETEEQIEQYLINSEAVELGGIKLLFVAQQGSPGAGGRFDLIGVDRQGDVVIVELKRGRSPRDIVAQALEYAASVRREDYDDLQEQYRDLTDDEDASLSDAHSVFFDREGDPLEEPEYNTKQRLLLLGGGFSDLSLDMADFLREYGIDVVCVTYSSFVTRDDSRIITTESIRPPLSDTTNLPPEREDSVIELLDGGVVVERFEERTQADAIEAVANYLIEQRGLLERIDLPYVPGDSRALINNTPTDPDGAEMKRYRELTGGHFLLTNLTGSQKEDYIGTLVEKCGLDSRFEF